jgi:hypothetical protein
MVTASAIETARELYVAHGANERSRCHVDRPGLARNDSPDDAVAETPFISCHGNGDQAAPDVK